MTNLLAQIKLYPSAGFRGIGPLGLENKSAFDSITIFNTVISTTIGIMTVIGVIWFLVVFVGGIIAIIGSGGDKGKLEQARSRMFTAVIGLVVLVSALFLVDLLGNLIGLNILGSIINIQKIIQ